MAVAARPVRTLEHVADYRCRHSGVCCRSGWGIPMASDDYRHVLDAVDAGTVTLDTGSRTDALRLPPGATGTVVLPTHNGACTFHDARAARCAIHRGLGETVLPSACRHFPRVVRADRDAIRVTFSHYCPTVANVITSARDAPLAEATDPPSCPPHTVAEGLETTGAGAPLLTPTIFFDHEAYVRFEQSMVRDLSGPHGCAWALQTIHLQVEELRVWQPGRGGLEAALTTALARHASYPARENPVVLSADEYRWFEEVRLAIPPIIRRPDAVVDASAGFDRLVRPSWSTLERAAGTYLAARAFANWTAYLGRGLRTVLRSLEVALAVLKVELVRAAVRRQMVATPSLVAEAAAAADLLLVHLSNPTTLAGLWGDAEGPSTLSARRPRRRAFGR